MNQLYNDRLFGNYLNMTFSDIYPSAEEFMEDAQGLAAKLIPEDFTPDSLEITYYLLLARYANSSIAAADVNRFKLQLFSLIYQFGGTWQKKVELQKKIRTLAETEARKSNVQINNHAYNPATQTSTTAFDPLKHIDQKSAATQTKGLLETYAQIGLLLDDSITEDFISHFKKLFLWFVSPQRPLFYMDLADNDLTNENL